MISDEVRGSKGHILSAEGAAGTLCLADQNKSWRYSNSSRLWSKASSSKNWVKAYDDIVVKCNNH